MTRSGLSQADLAGTAGAIRQGEAHQDSQIKKIDEQAKEIEQLTQELQSIEEGDELADEEIKILESNNAAMVKQLKDQDLRTERQHREWSKEIDRLNEEVGFWMGEDQDDRPEMIEYTSLVDLTTRTPEQQNRIREIANQIRIENEQEPELRERIEQLEKKNKRLEFIIDGAKICLTAPQEGDDVHT